MQKPCSECGGQMVKMDMAGHQERPALVGDASSAHYSRDALVPLERALVCVQCGYTRFFVDPRKLRRHSGAAPGAA